MEPPVAAAPGSDFVPRCISLWLRDNRQSRASKNPATGLTNTEPGAVATGRTRDMHLQCTMFTGMRGIWKFVLNGTSGRYPLPVLILCSSGARVLRRKLKRRELGTKTQRQNATPRR